MTDTSINRTYKFTKEELATLFLCIDCGVKTDVIGEYYMVNDDVWQSAGLPPNIIGAIKPEMLCIGCLETRIRRRLMPWDFMAVQANILDPKSPRLYSRLFGKHWRKHKIARYWAVMSAAHYAERGAP